LAIDVIRPSESYAVLLVFAVPFTEFVNTLPNGSYVKETTLVGRGPETDARRPAPSAAEEVIGLKVYVVVPTPSVIEVSLG
jgi:hypothetical protein